MKLHRYLPLLAIALIGAALARPALGDGARGEQLPAVDRSTPEAAPFETNIPPVGDAGEDDRPTNSDAALAHLRAVKQCAAEHGVTLPEPVANAEVCNSAGTDRRARKPRPPSRDVIRLRVRRNGEHVRGEATAKSG
jgi:hypothetical protein